MATLGTKDRAKLTTLSDTDKLCVVSIESTNCGRLALNVGLLVQHRGVEEVLHHAFWYASCEVPSCMGDPHTSTTTLR